MALPCPLLAKEGVWGRLAMPKIIANGKTCLA